MTAVWLRVSLATLMGAMWPAAAAAQIFSQRGFVESTVWLFPRSAPNDTARVTGDLLLRDDLFVKPQTWLQLAAGVDVRANSHDQVDGRWRLDMSDRGARRPAISLRRLSATFSRSRFTLEAGKQFVRWGKTDIVAPTDRFAPRDFLNVVDAEFLAIRAVRGTAQVGDNSFEAVWAPAFTPSRIPLPGQRWTVAPPAAQGIPLVDAGAVFPSGQQSGLRWAHVGQSFEYSVSFFDGFDNLPTIQYQARQTPIELDLTREYPSIRMYGADFAMPGRWFALKAEAAYVRSASTATDDYVLYVLQLERQRGEWVFVGGYAGEAVTRPGSAPAFAPDRGLSRAFIGRASYTMGPNRSVAVEAVARQNGHGGYAKVEYSQARGQHWRATVAVRAFGGRADDFLGQYARNSHGAVTIRYSF